MGYIGNKYSERAKECYDSNILPMSQWTKRQLLEEIEFEYEIQEIYEIKLEKLPLEVLRNVFLVYDSWHHTGTYYKETKFYRLVEIDDMDWVYKNLKSQIEERKKQKCTPQIEPMEKVYYRWIEWKGTRKYPKLQEYKDYGIKIGNWIYGYDSNGYFRKKNIYSNGVEILKGFFKAPRGYAEYFKDIEKQIPKSKKQKGGK